MSNPNNLHDVYYDTEVSRGRDPTTIPRNITDNLSPTHPGYTGGGRTPTSEDTAIGELTPEAVEKCRKLASVTFPKAEDNPEHMKKYDAAKKVMDNSYKTMWEIVNGDVTGDFGHARAHAEVIYNKCSDVWNVMNIVRKGKYQEECVIALKMLAREHSLRFSPGGVSFAMPVFHLKGEEGHLEAGIECVIDDLRCNIMFNSNGVKILVKGSKTRLHGKWHPHVNSDGTPCTGEIKHYYEARLKEGDVYEATRVLIDALSNYNDASAYHKIKHFWGFTCGCGNVVAQPMSVFAAVEIDGRRVKEKRECCERCSVSCPSCSTRWHKDMAGLNEPTEGQPKTCIHCRTDCVSCGHGITSFQLVRLVGQTESKHCAFCCFGCSECGRWSERSEVSYVRAISNGSCKIFCKTCGVHPLRNKHCIEVHLNDMPALKNVAVCDLAAYAYREALKLGLKTVGQNAQEVQQPVTQGDVA